MPPPSTNSSRNGKKKYLLLLLLLLLLAAAFYSFFRWFIKTETSPKTILQSQTNHPKGGISEGPVQVRGRKLYVDGKPYLIKGVGYHPVPIGKGPGFNFLQRPEIWKRDLPLLRKMGCNTIRLWAGTPPREFLDACWNDGRKPIRVVMGFWIPYDVDLSEPGNRKRLKRRFAEFVLHYKDHPAVLFWALGNENNYFYTASMLKDFYKFCNELAYMAWKAEGERYHPVAIVNGGLFAHKGFWRPGGEVGEEKNGTDDTSLKYIDIWGANLYPGKHLTDIFHRYERASKKPLWVSEFGVDAWNSRRGRTQETEQARWTLTLWRDIAHSKIAIGGTVMAWSDEWWKDSNGSPFTHDYGGYANPRGHPDGYSNEEWYGIMETIADPSGLDRLRPRKLYYVLAKEWNRSS